MLSTSVLLWLGGFTVVPGILGRTVFMTCDPARLRYVKMVTRLPSGKHTKSYGKLPFIVDLPIKNGDFP